MGALLLLSARNSRFFLPIALRIILGESLVGLSHALNVELQADCLATGQYSDLGLSSCLLWLLMHANAELAPAIVFFCTFERAEDVRSDRVSSVCRLAQAASVFARPASATGQLAHIATALVSLSIHQLALVHGDNGFVGQIVDTAVGPSAQLLTKGLIVNGRSLLVVFAVK